MLDAVIVGARCAGAPLAMLLARAGYRVVALDRDHFPSDTLSTAFLQEEAIERLDAWGVLGPLLDAGTPEVETVRFHAMGMTFPRPPLPHAALAPRRTVLDALLVEAARAAGAEVREGASVRALLRDGDGRVCGVDGVAGGVPFREEARIVIGADGRNSFVAKAVGAQRYREHPGTACGFYSYYEGMPGDSADLLLGDHHALFSFPTNDGLTCLAVEAPIDRWGTFRADPDAYLMDAFQRWGGPLAPYAARAKRVERWYGQRGPGSYFRAAHGPGWALAGDAGYLKDPILGTGIDDAFRDAAALAGAIAAGLSGREPLDEALAGYQAARDASQEGKYELICDMATLNFTPQLLQRMATSMPGGPRDRTTP
jgi:flavin-dependent dehydrogenase